MSETLTRLRSVATAMDIELAAVYAKYGYKVHTRRATVTDTKVTYKTILIDTKTGAGQPDPFAKEYLRYADLFGLKREWLGSVFVHAGESFKVVGLNTRRPKNCVMIETLKGKRKICSPDLLKFAARAAA